MTMPPTTEPQPEAWLRGYHAAQGVRGVATGERITKFVDGHELPAGSLRLRDKQIDRWTVALPSDPWIATARNVWRTRGGEAWDGHAWGPIASSTPLTT